MRLRPEAGREHPYVSAWWPPGQGLGYEHGFTHQVVDLVAAIAENRQPTPSFDAGLRVPGARRRRGQRARLGLDHCLARFHGHLPPLVCAHHGRSIGNHLGARPTLDDRLDLGEGADGGPLPRSLREQRGCLDLRPHRACSDGQRTQLCGCGHTE
jgi:hypothetical protein